MTSTISLQEDFNTIISEGCRNVTYNQLKPKCEHSTTIIYRQGTRSSVTEIQIFEKLFPEHILETICMEINKNISLYDEVKSTITPDKLLLLIGFILEAGFQKKVDLRTHLRDNNSGTSLRYLWGIFSKYIEFDETYLFNLFNTNYKKYVEPGGHFSLDEQIWHWNGEDPSCIYIPRKPNPNGFKIICICAWLTSSRRPYCYHFIPDLANDKITPSLALDCTLQLLPRKRTSVTADCWFGSLNWLEHNKDSLYTLAIGANQRPYLTRVFALNLKPSEWRTFTNDKIVMTVFADNKLMVTATTCFDVLLDPIFKIKSQSAVELTDLKPRFSVEAAEIFSSLPLDDLKVLSANFGERISIYFYKYIVIFLLIIYLIRWY